MVTRRALLVGAGSAGALSILTPPRWASAQVIETVFAAIGPGLASGVLGVIGGEAFKSAFGFPSLEGVVGKAAEDLKRFIVAIEEANFLDTCNRRIQGLYSLLHQYHNAPDTSEHRLDTIDTESNELMFLLVGRGVASFPIFAIAVSLRAAALYTRYERYHDAGELVNLQSLLGVSGGSLGDLLAQIRGKVAEQITDLEDLGFGTTVENQGSDPPSFRVRHRGVFRFYVGGAERKIVGPEEISRDRAAVTGRASATTARQTELDRVNQAIAQVEAAFGQPGDRVRSIWDSIIQRTTSLTPPAKEPA